MVNPLLFSPSPRTIKPVMDLWETLPYDHLIEKFRLPLEAYQNARNFFLDHEEYTHIAVLPDDLEVTKKVIDQLVEDIENYEYQVIGGLCNIDETQPYTYNIQPLGCDYSKDSPAVQKGAWYEADELETMKDDIIPVGFNGFACVMIERDVMKKLSFRGANNDGGSNMDWQVARECHSMGITEMCDLRCDMWHRRKEQWAEAKAFKNGVIHQNEGESILKTAKGKGFS